MFKPTDKRTLLLLVDVSACHDEILLFLVVFPEQSRFIGKLVLDDLQFRFCIMPQILLLSVIECIKVSGSQVNTAHTVQMPFRFGKFSVHPFQGFGVFIGGIAENRKVTYGCSNSRNQ